MWFTILAERFGPAVIDAETATPRPASSSRNIRSERHRAASDALASLWDPLDDPAGSTLRHRPMHRFVGLQRVEIPSIRGAVVSTPDRHTLARASCSSFAVRMLPQRASTRRRDLPRTAVLMAATIGCALGCGAPSSPTPPDDEEPDGDACVLEIEPAMGDADTEFVAAATANGTWCAFEVDGEARGEFPCATPQPFHGADLGPGPHTITLTVDGGSFGKKPCTGTVEVVGDIACDLRVGPHEGTTRTTFTATVSAVGTSCAVDLDGLRTIPVPCDGVPPSSKRRGAGRTRRSSSIATDPGRRRANDARRPRWNLWPIGVDPELGPMPTPTAFAREATVARAVRRRRSRSGRPATAREVPVARLARAPHTYARRPRGTGWRDRVRDFIDRTERDELLDRGRSGSSGDLDDHFTPSMSSNGSSCRPWSVASIAAGSLHARSEHYAASLGAGEHVATLIVGDGDPAPLDATRR